MDGTARLEQGRKEAVERLVVPQIGLLYRAALRLSGNRVDAEDLVQDTLLRAYRGIDKFDGRYPRAWLLTILRNTFINRGRARKPEVLMPGNEMASVTDAAPSGGPGPTEQTVLDRAFESEVAAAFQSLPEKFRSVVELVDIDGLSYAEAAAMLSVPVGTVMSRLHRGRAKMKEHLASQGINRRGEAR